MNLENDKALPELRKPTMPERIRAAHERSTEDLCAEALAALTALSVRAERLALTAVRYQTNRALNAVLSIASADDFPELVSGGPR